ncbi:MAG: PaaI family thioesterase [Saprospiraceae bacterium]|nr:PaaI family thioesterase [Saprospiraceae bacterium]
MDKSHYEKLEKVYLDAKINTQLFETTTIKVEDGEAQITLEVHDKYFHGMHAMHGAVYFKLLDDAAFFAVNSKVPDVFVLTAEFNIKLIRPVAHGQVKAIGKCIDSTNNKLIGSAELYNEAGKIIAKGTGQFVRSKIKLPS